MEGPAVNWGTAGTLGEPVASFLLQQIPNDPNGKAFDSVKGLNSKPTTVDGLPAEEADFKGTTFIMVRQGKTEYFAELNVGGTNDQLSQPAQQLTGALIADISGA